jgi:heme A synthase
MFFTTRSAFRYYAKDKAILLVMMFGMFLLGLQVMLGAITIWTAKAVTPATLHVSCGAALLGTMVSVMILVWHRYAPAVERSAEVSGVPSPALS